MSTPLLATALSLPKPLARVADIAQNPLLLALWGLALLMLLSLPFFYVRIRRRKIRRSYPRNPLEPVQALR